MKTYIKFKNIILASCLCCIALSGCSQTTKVTYASKEQITKAKNNALNYMQLDNGLTSKENYKSNILKIKDVSTTDFFNMYYGDMEAMQTGLPDTTIDYKNNVSDSSCEYNIDTSEYTVLILADESFGETSYGYTSVVKVTDDFLISGYEKISHMSFD